MTGRYLIYNLNLKEEETVLDKDLQGYLGEIYAPIFSSSLASTPKCTHSSTLLAFERNRP